MIMITTTTMMMCVKISRNYISTNYIRGDASLGSGIGPQTLHLQNIWGPLDLSLRENAPPLQKRTEKEQEISVAGRLLSDISVRSPFLIYWESRALVMKDRELIDKGEKTATDKQPKIIIQNLPQDFIYSITNNQIQTAAA